MHLPFIGHFDGHGPWQCASVRLGANLPMEMVQGFPRRHWMSPLGYDSLRIVPSCVTGKKQWWVNAPHLLAISMAMWDVPVQCGTHCPIPVLHYMPLDVACRQWCVYMFHSPGDHHGHRQNMTMEYSLLWWLLFQWPWQCAMRRYDTVCITQWRRFRPLVEASRFHHWASIHSDRRNQTHKCQFLWYLHGRLVEKGNRRHLLSIGVWYIKTMRITNLNLTNMTVYFIWKA